MIIRKMAACFLLYGATSVVASSPVSLKTTTPITIINLDKDTGRWQSVTKELASKGVPPDRIVRLPAVYGKELSSDELRANVTPLARAICTPGMIGCYLSHRAFWERTLSGEAPWQIVLEDDVLVSENFCEKVEEVVKELQSTEETRDKWDVLLLGAIGCVNPHGRHGFNRINAIAAGNSRKRRRVTKHCQVPRRPFGTHAYVLSKRGAEKLLRRAWMANGHVDVVAWGIQELFLLCCDPMLAFQDMNTQSTIGAITGGVETWLPKFKVDSYTGITVEWALNEPLFRIPGFGVLITIGRGLVWAASGLLLGFAFRQKVPWLLPVHSAAIVGLVVFLRVMNAPVGRLSSTIPADAHIHQPVVSVASENSPQEPVAI